MTTDLTDIGPEGLKNWQKWCEETVKEWNAKTNLTPEQEREKQEAQSDLDQVNALLAVQQSV